MESISFSNDLTILWGGKNSTRAHVRGYIQGMIRLGTKVIFQKPQYKKKKKM